MPLTSLTPEGQDDISFRNATEWTHAQVKSRRAHLGDFSPAQVASDLASVWKAARARGDADTSARIALVLERPIRNLPATGWGIAISAHEQLATALRPILAGLLNIPEDVDQLLDQASVVVVPDPLIEALNRVSARIDLPLEACIPHVQLVRAALQDAADANGVVTLEHAHSITVGDVQRLLDRATELIDVATLGEALREGICEVADFLTPVNDGRFYEGIDVVPGHVVAGLTLPRPDDEDKAIQLVTEHRSVLIIGPSGSGKSALAWMSAYAMRHTMRWYRVRRLQVADVNPLLRLIRTALPSSAAPIGLVADNLGQGQREGWDLLVSETAAYDSVHLLGVVREEDLPLVQTAPLSKQLRPTLDEDLAERLWSEYRTRARTAWQEWREPFEQSNGLLLEYGYILSTGERLRSTIESQIARRLNEHRDLELRLLRLVAAAHVWGSRITVGAIRRWLPDLSDEELQRALTRLVDEHLLAEPCEGHYQGLHQARSRHILDATHLLGVPSLAETIRSTLDLLDPEWLQPYLCGVILDGVLDADEAVAALARRLRQHPDPALLAVALQSFRFIGFFETARQWNIVMDRTAVPRPKRPITTQFAMLGIDNEHFTPSIRAALADMAPESRLDERPRLLDEIGSPVLSEIAKACQTPRAVIGLLAAMIGVPLTVPQRTALVQISLELIELELDKLALLIGTARAVDTELAREYQHRAGRTDVLLRRVETERPWVRNVFVSQSGDDEDTAHADLLVCSSSASEVHEDVVSLCRLVLNLFPEVGVAACRAVDATGEAAGYADHKIADKRLTRRAVPSQAEIAWNRARMQIVINVVASGTHTDRLVLESELLSDLVPAFVDAADYWCLGQRPPHRTANTLLASIHRLDSLPVAPASSALNLGPLDLGDHNLADPFDGMVSGTVNVANRLFEPEANLGSLAAYLHDTVAKDARALRSARWHLLSEPPSKPLSVILAVFDDLFTVVKEVHYGTSLDREGLTRLARRVRSGSVLGRCSEIARASADRRLEHQIQSLSDVLCEDDRRAVVLTRPASTPTGLLLPDDEVLVLMPVETLLDWPRLQETIVQAVSDLLEPVRSVWAAPVRGELVFRSLGGRVQNRFYPIPDEISSWVVTEPLRVSPEVVCTAFWTTLEALVEVSSIMGGTTLDRLHPVEEDAVKSALATVKQQSEELSSLSSIDDSGFIGDALTFIQEIADDVQTQIDSPSEDASSFPRVAASFLEPSRGRSSDLANRAGLIRLCLLEIDAEPQGAWQRVHNALQRLEDAAP